MGVRFLHFPPSKLNHTYLGLALVLRRLLFAEAVAVAKKNTSASHFYIEPEWNYEIKDSSTYLVLNLFLHTCVKKMLRSI